MRRASSVVLLLAVVLALEPATPAGAQQSGARAELIAAQLRRDPVYVSDSLARVATPEAVARVRAAAARWDQPLWVVWAPSFAAEPGVETAGDLLAQVRDRLDRPGLYVLMGEDGISDATLASGPVRTRGDVDRAGLVGSTDVPLWRGPGPRLVYRLDYLRTGERPTRGAGRAYLDRDDAAARKGLLLLAATTVASWLALTLLWPRRRRGRGTLREGTAPPATVISDAVVELSALTDRLADTPSAPATARDAEAAARGVLDREPGQPIPMTGVLVLARTGRAALDGEPHRRPCFVNPLHGWAGTETRFARGGQTVPVPVCVHCARYLDRDLPVDALLDGRRPYWERDTIWARTGFGALDGRLAADLLAGRR